MKFKVIIVGLIIVTILFIIGLSPLFNVDTVYVENYNRVSQDTILKTTTLDTYESNIFLYPAKKYEKQLLSNAYINNVTISKVLPNTIIVSVDERNLIAYVMYSDDTYLFINEEGIILDSKQYITEQLPIITGIGFDKFSVGEKIDVDNPESLKVAEELSTILIRYNADNKEVKIDTRDVDNITLEINNLSIIFGDFSNADEKVRLMLASIDAMPDENIKGFLYVNDVTQSPRLKIIT